MPNVSTLIQRLSDYQVKVRWTEDLDSPGLFIKSHRMLLLDVGASTVTLAGVCAELLARLTPGLSLPL